MSRFLGFESPNFTQAPNEFYDVLLREIDTLAELKVTELAIRFTFGFQRKSARMSISFFEHGCGITRPTAIAGINAAVARGTLKRDKRTSRITMNFKLGSKAALLADSKESLPKLAKSFYPRKKKEFNNSIKDKYTRPPGGISGKLAGVVRSESE